MQGYLIWRKHPVTFTLERLDAWGSLILQENALKNLSSLQYLTIYLPSTDHVSGHLKQDDKIVSVRVL